MILRCRMLDKHKSALCSTSTLYMYLEVLAKIKMFIPEP